MHRLPGLLMALTLAGCAAGNPPLPRQEVSARFTSPLPQGETAGPDWFARFGDPSLNELQTLARANNPDLRSAAATVAKARAVEAGSLADLWPAASASASQTRADTGTTQAQGIDASWEIDLFGGLASTAKADRASRRAEDLAYAGADISLMAEVADDYVQYRACRLEEAIYRETLASQKGTQEATGSLSAAGLSASADTALAGAGVATAAISLESQRATCRVLAQSLATVTGVAQEKVDAILARGGGLPRASAFRITAVPADALRQRPDVLEAEADLATAMAKVGTARAALWPSLTLNGAVGLSDGGWSFGPVVNLPLFNGGGQTALRGAKADAVIAGETWRKTILSAVAEIEGALTQLNAARRNAAEAATAAKGYADYFAAVDANWQAGGDTLLNRESALRNLQTARLTEVQEREAQLRQSIALYKAVGGGWHDTGATK